MNKCVLITGSLGLVGTAASEMCIEKGYAWIGVDNNMRSKLFGTKKNLNHAVKIDIRDQAKVESLFVRNKFDAIIHTAAQPSHDWAKNDPLVDFDINARATLILLEATRKYCPEAVFVHVSTDKVYGENMHRLETVGDPLGQGFLVEGITHYGCIKPFDEELGLDFAGKRSLFGCSKTAADIYVQEYGNYFGMKTVCFRCGCITGKAHAGAEYHGFLAYLAKCIKEGKIYNIYGYQGKQVRDQIHANDLASAFYEFIENPKVAAVYNMGGGPERSVSILEAGEMLSKAIGKPFKYEFRSEREGDRIWDVHDVSKFRKDYPGWDYKYSLLDIIKELCEV